MYTYVASKMLAAEGIEPITIRFKAQCFAFELFANTLKLNFLCIM